MKLSTSVEALAALVVGLLTVLLVILIMGCSGAPELKSGGIEGTIVVRTPEGPLTISAGTNLVISAPTDGYSVEGYELRAVAVLSGGLAGDYTSVEITARDRCVVVTTSGAINLSAPVPGTICGGGNTNSDEVDKPAPEVAELPGS